MVDGRILQVHVFPSTCSPPGTASPQHPGPDLEKAYCNRRIAGVFCGPE